MRHGIKLNSSAKGLASFLLSLESLSPKHLPASILKAGLTWLRHGADVHALLLSHEAQHREDGEACQETGAAVQEAQQERVPGRRHTNTHTQELLKHYGRIEMLETLLEFGEKI